MTPLAPLFTLAFLVSVDVRILGHAALHRRLAGHHRRLGRSGHDELRARYGSGQLVYGPLSGHFGRIAVVRLAAVRFGRAW